MATEMNVEAERAAFEAWARNTDQGYASLKGTDAPGGWYYFEDDAQAAWAAWQAARRAAQPADVGATELPELPEPCQSVMPSGWIRYTADQMRQYARAALAHKAAPAPAADQDALDAKRWRWLKSRFTGYDFYWMGNPPYEEKEDQGKCVIVFECGENFDAGRDFEKAIDASLAATSVTDQPKQENQQ